MTSVNTQFKVHLVLALNFFRTCLALCPPTGPVLPPPVLSNGAWNAEYLERKINSLVKDGPPELLIENSTFFSVSITSKHETIFSYHYTPPVYNTSGTHKAIGSSVQRIASVTKLFTVLAILLEPQMSLDDPVAKYVPELATQTNWADVTLRMLAGQHGGIARSVPVFDIEIFSPLPFHELGFPKLNSSDLPKCSGDLTQPPCSRSEFFDYFLQEQFVWLPGDKAAYSDLAFIILGYALEAATGMAYRDAVRSAITSPLGLHNTRFQTPEIGNAMVPIDTPWFGFDIGNFESTAGLYSTPDDLCTFLRHIMNFTLLSPAQTREWLKPGIFTASTSSSVGLPWEIYRTSSLTNQPRPIDLYTKDGDFPDPGGYAAHVTLIPEYDIGIAITGAGNSAYNVVTQLLNVVASQAIQQLEQLARSEADSIYGGQYIGKGSHANDTQLFLAVDEGPGIKITKWTNNGADMLGSLAEIVQGEASPAAIDARIYPIDGKSRWRLQVEDVSMKIDARSGAITGEACFTWSSVDDIRYGLLPVDEFDFIQKVQDDGSIVVEGLILVGLRSELVKAS